MVQHSHLYMTTGKSHSFDCTDLCWQSDVSALWHAIIAFLPRSKCLLISWLQSLSTWFWSPGKYCFHFFLIYLPWSDRTRLHELSFWMLSFKPAFSLAFSSALRGSLVLLQVHPFGWCDLPIWGCWYLSRQTWCQLVSHSPSILCDVLCI